MAGLSIRICWRYPERWRAKALLVRAARAAAHAAGFARGRLSLAVVDSAEMAALHRRFGGTSGPTDVLSFDYGGDVGTGLIDGEVVVCADVAHDRAARRSAKRSEARAELALYVVHGVLHLGGFDDHDPAAAKRMHRREDRILTRLGLGPVFSAGEKTRQEARSLRRKPRVARTGGLESAGRQQ